MKKRAIAVLFLFASITAGYATTPMLSFVYAGFDEGNSAYNRGDYATAYKEFKEAADQGNALAQCSLGWMYYTGLGVPRSYTQAVKWTRKAADQGQDQAQNNLGLMYVAGHGVTRNYAEALKWYRMAADKGNDSAQFNLGLMYLMGHGVPKNFIDAAKWFRNSADQGDAQAQYNLGVMYDRGLGVPKNYVYAYFWANLASSTGLKSAIALRQRLSRLMNPAQIAQAQEMSANWHPASLVPLGPNYRPPASFGTFEPIGPDEPEPPMPEGFHPAEQNQETPKQAASMQPQQQAQVQSGTGFIVSRKGHVLTNYHVIEGCTMIQCDLGGKATVLTLVQADTRNDLALLKLDITQSSPLKFRDGKSIRAGDGIVVMGFPLPQILANQANVTTGSVSAMAGPGNDTRILQITAPVQPGNSGGPVLDMTGNVVGVATSKLDAIKTAQLTGDLPQNVNFAINAAAIRAFLDANGVDYETSSSTKRLEASEIGELARKATLLIVGSK